MKNLLLLPLILAPMAACKSNERQAPPPSDLAGPNMSGKVERGMANCPSAVPGAVTKIALTADGVDVTVTAPDPQAQRKIVTLADFHARTPGSLAPWPHSGLRSGGSHIGHCPILHEHTTITAAAVPGGVRLQLRADAPSRVKELQDIISARVARLPGFPSS